MLFVSAAGCNQDGGQADSSKTSKSRQTKTASASQATGGQTRARAPRPAAPDFSVAGIDGGTLNFEDYKGKVIFLDFWATWCGPCKMSIPHLIDLYEEYKDEGFVVLGVAVDRGGMRAVKSFAEKMNIPYPVGLDDGRVAGLYGGIRSIPTAFVIDRDGLVQERVIGFRPKSDLEKIIKAYL